MLVKSNLSCCVLSNLQKKNLINKFRLEINHFSRGLKMVLFRSGLKNAISVEELL